jgi:hypothetical protein
MIPRITGEKEKSRKKGNILATIFLKHTSNRLWAQQLPDDEMNFIHGNTVQLNV